MTDLICIVCPRGCHLHVDENMNVTGNFCPRGIKYAKEELTEPKRAIAATVKLISKDRLRLPVHSSSNIPKDKIFEVMNIINKTVVKAPIKMDEVIIKDVLGLKVDILSSIEVNA